ncbi:MAG: sulfatase-like hydrolase/transferase [Prevotellaceae bacterium]|nr:sulfatase-like hydrolase/transferase [Prevotellaceae bacterium]
MRHPFAFLKAQPAWALLCNFLLIMAIFTLSRIFFFVMNKSYFPEVDAAHLLAMLWGGLQFDLTALLYINSLYLLMQLLPFGFRHRGAYQTVARWVFALANGIAVIVNCMDMPFFRFSNRRATCTIFSEFGNDTGGVLKIVLKAMAEYWYVTLFAVAAVAALWLLYRTPSSTGVRRTGLAYYMAHTVIMVVLGGFAVIGIRGGFNFHARPVTLINANRYVNRGPETVIVLNTPFCLIRTINKKVFKNPHYFDTDTETEKTALFSPLHHPTPEGAFRPLNVVVIIWESFGKEYTGFFNRHLDNGTYRGYTPFLDSLFAQGLTFKYSFSNGRRSVDAMPSILSSVPTFVESFIATPYLVNYISSLADALKPKGYYSAFFHGAPNGSMGFQPYAKAADFDDYFGFNEYGNSKDFDGWWAIWDEDFLQFYAAEMGKMKQPFITAVFTATSHHPFQIPEKYRGKFPQGDHPILQCIAYSDYSMEQFFRTMSQYEWFNNTLFVITADHTNQPLHEEYYTDLGLFAVPILFYHPGNNLKGLVDSIPVQQTDIMPSVLGYLNFDKPYFAYGQDIFATKASDKFVINYNNGVYQLLQNGYMQQFDGEKIKAAYSYKTDTLLHHNLNGQIAGQKEMEMLTKSVIQQYMERMIENKMRVSE